ncbi:BOK [Bugula neritina]|uniref:BOK n=1 Tax=Bugula neritina TaxID=10212 RepID=A0A7J7ISR1_BUGNE|nr:BOK [Bugula neritina]
MGSTGEWSLASQGRVFCQHYVVQRSLKAGAQVKRLKSLFYTKSGCEVNDVYAGRMLEILQTMEHLHPSVYKSCSATLKVTMSSDDQVRWSYENITKELLKTGVNWGKLISIFTVCGALADDCVTQGHTDFLPVILDCFEESCSQPLLNTYLKEGNGWKGVIDYYDNQVNNKHRNKATHNDKISLIISKSIEMFQHLSQYIDKRLISAMVLVVLTILTFTKIFFKDAKT